MGKLKEWALVHPNQELPHEEDLVLEADASYPLGGMIEPYDIYKEYEN
jgi:hypothetical protein